LRRIDGDSISDLRDNQPVLIRFVTLDIVKALEQRSERLENGAITLASARRPAGGPFLLRPLMM
jgi:hypothetical protein